MGDHPMQALLAPLPHTSMHPPSRFGGFRARKAVLFFSGDSPCQTPCDRLVFGAIRSDSGLS